MATFTEGERISKTGMKLFTLSVLPPTLPPKAVLMFHHGLGEHVGRYKAGEESSPTAMQVKMALLIAVGRH